MLITEVMASIKGDTITISEEPITRKEVLNKDEVLFILTILNKRSKYETRVGIRIALN
jgi:hypothetical protein